MNFASKIFLFGLAGALLLCGLFYLWLVIAYVPPKGPDDGTRHRLVKEGKFAGDVHFRILRVEKNKVLERFEVKGGTRNATGTIEYSRLLYVYGPPQPVDVRWLEKQRLEVLFDGPLSDGARAMIIETNEVYGTAQPWELQGGKLQLSASW